MAHYYSKRSSLVRIYKNELERNGFNIGENNELIEEIKNLPRQNTTTDQEIAKLANHNQRLEMRNEHLRALIESLQKPATTEKSLVNGQPIHN